MTDPVLLALLNHLTGQVDELTLSNRKLVALVEGLRRALPAQLVTVQQAAAHLGISERTVHRKVKDGSIPVRKVGKAVRIDLTALSHAPTAEEVAKFTGPMRPA